VLIEMIELWVGALHEAPGQGWFILGTGAS